MVNNEHFVYQYLYILAFWSLKNIYIYINRSLDQVFVLSSAICSADIKTMPRPTYLTQNSRRIDRKLLFS